MIIGIDASRANRAQKTGVEWYAFFLIQELKKIVPDNIQVVLYSEIPLVGELAKLPKNWTSKVLKWPPKRIWTQCRLSIEMLIFPPDVLFIPAHVFPYIHPKKTIMTVHDIAGIRFPESYNTFEKWYSTWSAKKALQKLYKIITPSQFTKDELLDVFGKKYQDKISVVHLAYNTDFDKKKKIDNIKDNIVLNKYKINKPYILSIGRIETKKNTGTSIDAFSLWKKKKKTNHQFVLIGKSGFGYDDIIEKINKSEFKKDINEIGYVDSEDLPVLLKSADVLLFPSLYEGFGIPALEAMASGVPVVATRGTSVEEIGKDSLWYAGGTDAKSIAKTLNEVFENKEEKEKKQKHGLEYVKEFSWEKMAKKTLSVLLN